MVFFFRDLQEVVANCGAKKNIVMGHCQVEKEIKNKKIWLNKHYPMIEEHLLVYEGQSKADTILRYCTEHGIDLKNVVFVDDVIPFLQEAERKGSHLFISAVFWIGITSLHLNMTMMYFSAYTMDEACFSHPSFPFCSCILVV